LDEKIKMMKQTGEGLLTDTIALAEKSAECGIFISGIAALRAGYRMAPGSDPAYVVKTLLCSALGQVDDDNPGGPNYVTAWSQRDRVVIPVARGQNRANAPSAIVYFRDPQVKREVMGWIKKFLFSQNARNVSVRDLFPAEKLEEVAQLTKLGFYLKSKNQISRFRIMNFRNKPVFQVTKGNNYFYSQLDDKEIESGLSQMVAEQSQQGPPTGGQRDHPGGQAQGPAGQQTGSRPESRQGGLAQRAAGGPWTEGRQDTETRMDTGSDERALALTGENEGPLQHEDIMRHARDTGARMKERETGAGQDNRQFQQFQHQQLPQRQLRNDRGQQRGPGGVGSFRGPHSGDGTYADRARGNNPYGSGGMIMNRQNYPNNNADYMNGIYARGFRMNFD